MQDFLLIHGSCHGAWCWRDVLPRLREAGHRATAIDLPGHGTDATPASDVTLELYARAILAAIDAPVTLVGHSMAGYPITLAAELAPAKIARLIYLCAYVPRPGLSLGDMRRDGPSQPLLPAIRRSDDGLTFTIDPAMATGCFYHDCPAETAADAVARLSPEPVLPQSTPIGTLVNWQGVERHYILCEDDRTIPPAYQATMSAGFPPGHVSHLPTSHSPFLAAPEALARRLIAIAEGGLRSFP